MQVKSVSMIGQNYEKNNAQIYEHNSLIPNGQAHLQQQVSNHIH